MRKFFLFCVFLIFSSGIASVSAQTNPYHWVIESEDLGEGQIQLKYVCKVDSGWHIYSLENNEDFGIPTKIELIPTLGVEILTEVEAERPIKKFDELYEDTVSFYEATVFFRQKIKVNTSELIDLKVAITTQACTPMGKCTRPETKTFDVSIQASDVEEKSSFWIFWAGMLAGFLALLTPCVFPLIPLTVTFFTKQAENRPKGVFRAFVYGVSIIVIYVSMGFLITTFLGPDVLNKMASSPVFNFIFFIILIVFSLSFLGMFEITIPGFIVNKIDAKADKGGWIGIFFMAFALALVSFSCTGPLIGTLLVEAAVNAGVKGPLLGMFGFSLALALPFTVFAIFPNWLKSLPKSGGWLNTVKVSLGLLEIALAVKFLSNVDLVYQARIITREVFIGIWILVFLVLALYIFNIIRFKHDRKLESLGLVRKILGVGLLSIVFYLASGFFGSSLKWLSGVLPPTFYTINWGGGERELTCPNNLDCYHDYDQALQIAKQEGKPLLLDFTGWTCVNCRYMEQNIWSVPEIDSLMRKEFIVVSLYVDDRTKIPENELDNENNIVTLGDKWAHFEITHFGEITQPLYVVVDENGNQIGGKQSYDVAPRKFKQFLTEALSLHKMAK